MAKRKDRDLSRKAPKRETYKTILIVCEGEKTEKLYFENLISTENLSSVNVQVYSGRGSDPKSVVETAIEEKDMQSQHLEFDEVYCVIDRDSHQTFDDAKQLAKGDNINLIVSYPSFEYWYLCHFKYSRAPIVKIGDKSAGDNCVASLNKEWNKNFSMNYNKAQQGVYRILLPYIETAIANSRRAFRETQIDGELNPSTAVHNLVDNLRKIKQ
ncbi:RloB family protein [Neisseria cinerea]|uniref:RloB family protein n=1 Tax=Neisseria cinerea TaxID=483 RepID=UPI000D350C31|nr:RloB family protein [Neisseria cinerea]